MNALQIIYFDSCFQTEPLRWSFWTLKKGSNWRMGLMIRLNLHYFSSGYAVTCLAPLISAAYLHFWYEVYSHAKTASSVNWHYHCMAYLHMLKDKSCFLLVSSHLQRTLGQFNSTFVTQHDRTGHSAVWQDAMQCEQCNAMKCKVNQRNLIPQYCHTTEQNSILLSYPDAKWLCIMTEPFQTKTFHTMDFISR